MSLEALESGKLFLFFLSALLLNNSGRLILVF